jgi:hypothetical protein
MNCQFKTDFSQKPSVSVLLFAKDWEAKKPPLKIGFLKFLFISKKRKKLKIWNTLWIQTIAG